MKCQLAKSLLPMLLHHIKKTHVCPPCPPHLHTSSEGSGMEVLSVDGKWKNHSNSPIDDIDSVQSSVVGDGAKAFWITWFFRIRCHKQRFTSRQSFADVNSMDSDDLQFSEIKDSSVYSFFVKISAKLLRNWGYAYCKSICKCNIESDQRHGAEKN